jgi:hypothetical protein
MEQAQMVKLPNLAPENGVLPAGQFPDLVQKAGMAMVNDLPPARSEDPAACSAPPGATRTAPPTL